MNEEYDIISVDKPDDSVWDVIGWGINNYNIQIAGNTQSKQLCFVLRAPDKKTVGGLIGKTYWDWLYIDLLFVKEELRGRGHGHRLLGMAEDEARKYGVLNVYLDTFSFQSPDFYKQHGYKIFGELKDFPAGHQRYFLRNNFRICVKLKGYLLKSKNGLTKHGLNPGDLSPSQAFFGCRVGG